MGEKEEGNGGKGEKGGGGMGEKMREGSWDAYWGGGREMNGNVGNVPIIIILLMNCRSYHAIYTKPNQSQCGLLSIVP